MTPHRPARRRAARAAVSLLAVTGLVLAACGDDGADTDAGTDAVDPAADVAVTGAWARTSPRVADAGAVYMQITNDGGADDALVGVDVDGAVAGRAELHETVAVDDDGAMDDDATDDGMDDDGATDDDGMDDDGMDDDGAMDDDAMGDGMDDDGTGGGMMEMRPVDRIDVPAGGSVALEPGSYHVMLLELAAPLEAGGTIEVTLVFEESGERVVTVDVRDDAP